MIETATIARPYAQAAFEQASEEDQLPRWSEVLQTLSQIVSDKTMRQVIHDPRISNERLTQLIMGIIGDKLTKTTSNFIRILVDAGRLTVATKIFEQFEEKRSIAEGKVEVHVLSAYPLSDDQKSKITQVMSKRLGKNVHVVSEVDQSLIGGAIIRAGDSVIDTSIKGRLQDLENLFAN